MKNTKKNLNLFIECLKKKEKDFQSKMRFCNEHNFKEEERLFRIKLNILNEIRIEAELIENNEIHEPKFYFD